MPGELSGPGYDFVDFIPQSKFVDSVTVGYENVKNETDIKLLRFSSSSSSRLLEDIKNLSKNPSILPITTYSPGSCDKFRHALLYSTADNLTNALTTSPLKFDAVNDSPPKICFLITCQSTQYAGMGKEVYSWSPVFQRHFDECDAILKEDYGLSVKDLMNSNDNAWVSNPLDALPYLLSLEYGLFKLWESWGIKPDIVLGMSFGEYGAAAFSGIISLKDAFKLIMTRTQLVTDHIKEEAFGVVEMDVNKIPEIMKELKSNNGMEDTWLDIACVNSPLQTCVVGYRKVVQKFVEICKQKGFKSMLLDPYHPYHCRLTAPVIPQFEEVTSQVDYKKSTNGKFIFTVRNGRVMESLDKNYYLEHLQGAALFADAMRTVLKDEGVTHFLEIGPHPINTQMVKDILENSFSEVGRNFQFYSSLLRKESDRVTLFNTLGRLYTAGFNINWENVN